jgi:poly(A) polymerase
MEQFAFLSPIFDAFEREGFKLFLVGGCVRDHFLNVEFNHTHRFKDFDLCTEALPNEVERILKGCNASISQKNGGNFGTVHCVLEGFEVEITTFRSDKDYPMNSRRPEVEFSTNAAEDLLRRDFKINAMLMTRRGTIIDPFEGKSDLIQKKLGSPQDPVKLMRDDPLRILRAYRFAHRFGLEIDSEVRRAIRQFAPLLRKEIDGERIIKSERIHDELLKIAETNTPHLAFREMMEDGVMQQILPELCNQVGYDQSNVHHHLPLWEHTLLTVEKAKELGGDRLVVLAALLHDIAKPVSCQVVWFCQGCQTKFRVSDETSGKGQWVKIEHCKCEVIDLSKITKTGQHSFHRHDEAGAFITDELLKQLKFSTNDRESIVKLIARHIDYSREWNVKAARRFVNDMGLLVDPMICLLKADRAAHAPGHDEIACFDKLTELLVGLDTVALVTPKLPIDGHVVMEMLNLSAGAELGRVMKALKQAVIDGQVVTVEDATEFVSDWVLKQPVET